ncbi:MAG: DUF4340 domain-containing protein [Candidatus Latescibacteria bacterium]|nr:DUF4340 domain-containing protein [Candidatus Latescibacterota bacterium]
MSFKTTIIVAILAIALGAYVYFYEIKGGEERQQAEQEAKKIFLFEDDQVKGLTLVHSGVEIVLARAEDGVWKITAPIETEADQGAVDALVRNLKNAETDRVVADSTADLALFGLDDPKVKVSLLLEKASTDTLCIGDKSPTGSYVFANRNGSREVFTTSSSLLTNVQKELFDLRDKRVLAFEKDEVKKFELNQRGKPLFVLSKTGSEWQMEQPQKLQGDRSAVDQILNKLKYGKAKAFVTEKTESVKPYGLDDPDIVVTLWLGKDKAKKQLKIGDAKSPDRYYARDEARDPIFTVDSTLVKELRKNLFDLRDKKIVKFLRSRINKIELVYADSSIVCQKDTSDNWRVTAPVVQKAKKWKVSGILSDIETLKAEEFVAEKATDLSRYGLDAPRITVKLWDDRKIQTQVFLGKAKGDLVYAKVSGKEAVYLVKDRIVEKLSPKVADLVEAEKKEEK